MSRTANAMDPDSREVHERLQAWGEWAKEGESLGYPPVTILGRMMDLGAVGAAHNGNTPIVMPDEIAVTDAAICRLCEIDRRTVREYYTRWEPPEVVARRLHMRYRQMQNVLKRARWRLIFHLRAIDLTQV